MTDARAVHFAVQAIADDIRSLPIAERFAVAAVLSHEATEMASDIRWSAVYELRCAGMTVTQAAEALGAGHTTIQLMTDRYREANPKDPVPFARLDMSTQAVIQSPAQRG